MNVEEILDELDIIYASAGESEHVTAGWIGVDCPWCGDCQEYHLGIHKNSGRCSCWQCGGHSLTAVLVETAKIDWRRAKKLSAGLDYALEEIEAHTGAYAAPYGVGELLPVHRRYLERRGFDPDYLVKRYGIGGIGIAPKLPWRLFIPITYRGELVSWTTRRIDKEKRFKYIGAKHSEEKIQAKSLLYASEFARHAICIVEGPADVWRIGNGAVATFGTSYTISQLRKMAAFPVRVVAFDAEAEAQRAADRLCSDLSVFAGKTTRVTIESKDPGCASDQEIEFLRGLLQ